ncbi:hypothetical protein [Streptomyces litchfieldiae]|uniref:HNH endonuclease n=1 Tax=Streptomyces litchfieldiae TaxID=3075543 RepID=A0ABU2N158_9ACTN|nr:hypothetical protein [Streptomyces sp. DSM 44938]MDT0347651.1 hypothetical protein [Streptomyces sp. DSM 44938]
MALPSWQDKKYGGKIRAALWLESVVGVGNIFTKTQLRQAFPQDTQIDRRVRDLRDHGWQIDTNRDDPSLNQDEQRYVSKGAEVWLPGQARVPRHKNSLTAAQRTKIMQGDNFLCRSCGIGGGEPYSDGIELAQLNVARREVRLSDGRVEHQLVTECKRCSSGNGGRVVDLHELVSLARRLSPLEQKVFAGWAEADRRQPSLLETLWGAYRTLPEESRRAIIQIMTSGSD